MERNAACNALLNVVLCLRQMAYAAFVNAATERAERLAQKTFDDVADLYDAMCYAHDRATARMMGR